jgi:predicted NBD/HSP70 family sugar kinase
VLLVISEIKLVKPKVKPPLDPRFRPAVVANHRFYQEASSFDLPVIFGLERENGKLTRYETLVFPEWHKRANENFFYAERIFKFLVWQRGGSKAYIGGPASIGKYIQECYARGGKRSFDYRFMSEHVYEKPVEIIACDPSDVPPANDYGNPLGRHLDGYRIGFDLGASDRKVSALIDGQVVYSEEVIWDPRNHSDPKYHFDEVLTAINTAASKMSRLDAIGGSSAGIYINNRPMVASLFRAIPPDRFAEIQNLFLKISEQMNVPLEVMNDGDISALAGSMSLGVNGILGLAMGSSEAAGFIDMDGCIMGWLNELAFAPIDFSPEAPIDEWSGDFGCGAQYLSQQCVFRLAPLTGIQIPREIPDKEKLDYVQEKLRHGHEGAYKIWQTLGIYLGYALAHYADFYNMNHVLLFGRCTSGEGGTIILECAHKVVASEFPELASKLHIQLPDEASRRVGQSIAAASLPIIIPRQEPQL